MLILTLNLKNNINLKKEGVKFLREQKWPLESGMAFRSRKKSTFSRILRARVAKNNFINDKNIQVVLNFLKSYYGRHKKPIKLYKTYKNHIKTVITHRIL